MSLTKRHLPIVVGALMLAGFVGEAHAAELNIGGSSAGKNFATDVPLNLCDAGVDINTYPKQFNHSDTNKITWSCNRGGLPTVIRYSATGSSDGVNKLLQPTNNAASNMTYMNHTDLTGCTGPVDTIRQSDQKHYARYTGCTATISIGTHMGASDVQGASFHQVGPFGTSVTALNDTTLNSVVTAVVPFSVFVGKGVVNVTGCSGSPATCTPNGQVAGLSRLQIEKIFSGSVTDWRRLGYGTTATDASTTTETTSPIVLCMRSAGSGTKAAFDETVMINDTEYSSIATATKVFSSSTSGVLDCLHANRRAIGYMDADQLMKFTTHASSGTDFFGDAYPVRIDGGLAFDQALTDKKKDLKCGRYSYWAGWRLNRRTTSEGADIDALAQAFVDNAGLQATISIIPTGAFWASDEEMAVSKNVDKGPLIWKAGDHFECLQP